MSSEGVKKCGNCEKDILEDKFILHEAFCVKYTSKCDICNETFDKSELEEHKETTHKVIDCIDCGKKMENRLMDTHKKRCNNKPDICSFCGLSLPKSEKHEHEHACGSKTEECHICGKLVIIKEYDLHIDYECEGEAYKSNLIKNNLTKKTKFSDFEKNLHNLHKEFSDCKESFNTKKKYDVSNNIPVKNKNIDDFIIKDTKPGHNNIKKLKKLEEDSKNKIKSESNGPDNINSKKLEQNISKIKQTVFPNNKKHKLIKPNSRPKTVDDHSQDCDEDILNSIIEISKQEK